MSNQELNSEEDILAPALKKAGQAYLLSEVRARDIVSKLKVPVISPLSSRLQRRDQGRSIISNFMTQVNIFMSTTAKVGLVALVLVLVGVFGYTQLGSKPGEYATDVNSSPTTTGAEEASGDIDEAVNVILASSASESLVISEEDADAALIDADSQELQDFSQSINDNDF